MAAFSDIGMAQTVKSEQPFMNDEADDGWHVEAVLGSEYTAPVHTMNALIDVIVDRKHTSRLVQELQRLSPISTLRHLKRVCPDGRILIRLADDSSKVESSSAEMSLSGNISLPVNSCTSLLEKYGNNSMGRKRSISDTAIKPQFSPENGPNNIKKQELIVDKCVLSVEEPSLSEESSERTSVSHKKNNLNTSDNELHSLQDKYCLPIGLNTEGLRGRLECVPVPAVAPLTRSQFVEAQHIWSCNFHPSHSVETAMAPGAGLKPEERKQLLAVLHRCMAMKQTSSTECTAAAVDLQGGRVLALAIDMRKTHPLQHAAMRLIDLVACTQNGGVWPQMPDEEIVIDRSDGITSRNGRAYLCTGLDIVMTREPCAMCAMALTHARASRVFFSEDNPRGGVLYSHSPPLHTLPGLNHRLRVFRAPLLKEATV